MKNTLYAEGAECWCCSLCPQLEKMNNRVKALKRQVDEAEEECARINAQKRKVQRELDDQMEQNDVLVRETQSLRKYR